MPWTPPAPPADPVSQILERYRSYLATERGLAESSIPVTMHVAESFCSKQDHRLEELSAAEVTAYIVALCARSSIGWSKKTVSALASFLRFLHVTGVTAQPLAIELEQMRLVPPGKHVLADGAVGLVERELTVSQARVVHIIG